MYVNVNGKLVSLTTEEYEALIANGSVPTTKPITKMDELIASVNSVAKAIGGGEGPTPGPVEPITYTISKENNTITLSGTDGSTSSVDDSNTIYNISIADKRISLNGSDNSVSHVDLPEETPATLNEVFDGTTRDYKLTLSHKDSSTVAIQYHLEKNDETNEVILKAGETVVDKIQLARDADTHYTLVKEGNELRLVPSDGSEAIVVELDPDLNTTYTIEFNNENNELSLIPNDNSLPTVVSLAKFASVDYVNTELDKKANVSDLPDLTPYAKSADVSTALEGKADKSSLEGLVNETALQEALEPFAKTETVNSALEQKADKTDLEGLATTAALNEAVTAINTEVDKKADKSEIPDISGLAEKTYVNSELEKKADASALEGLVSESALNTALEPYAKTEDLPDVSGFAVKTEVDTELGKKANTEDVNAELAKKADKTNLINNSGAIYNKLTINGDEALVFNESDGGGLMYTNNGQNVKSFVGVNSEGPTGVAAQIYSKFIKNSGDQVANKGCRLNINPNGFYYTNGKTNGSFTAEDELITKKDISDVATKDEVESGDVTVAENAESSLNALKAQIAILTKIIQDIKAPNPEEVAIDENVTVEGTDVIVNGGTVTGVIRSISGAKTVNADDVSLESARFVVNASDDVTLTNMNSTGNLAKSVSNAATSINTNGNVSVRDCVIDQSSYNTFEVCLANNTAPKSVVIDNVHFNGKLTNNAISIFSHQKNAEIVISNCTFEDCSNPVRISNKNNVPAKIKFINCTCNKWETAQAAYSGFLLLEDYTSKTEEEAEAANRFANLEITFENCYGPENVKIEGDAETLSDPTKQILYIYRDFGGLVAFDANKFPKVIAY